MPTTRQHTLRILRMWVRNELVVSNLEQKIMRYKSYLQLSQLTNIASWTEISFLSDVSCNSKFSFALKIKFVDVIERKCTMLLALTTTAEAWGPCYEANTWRKRRFRTKSHCLDEFARRVNNKHTKWCFCWLTGWIH